MTKKGRLLIAAMVITVGVLVWISAIIQRNLRENKSLTEEFGHSDPHIAEGTTFHSSVDLKNSLPEDEFLEEDRGSDAVAYISQEEAIQLAVEHVVKIGEGNSYDKDRPLGVSQTGTVVRVSFWAHTSPFYNPDKTYAVMIDVDLSTKELKTYAPQGFRRFPLGLMLPFSYDERSEEEYQEYGDRLTTVLSALGDQALQSGELPGIPEKSGSTISSTQAIEIADAVRKQGEYDKETPPHVSLVNGVYVVTYWKPNNVIDTAWKRYAYRICIDAESGEYIGMDYSTTASDNPPE